MVTSSLKQVLYNSIHRRKQTRVLIGKFCATITLMDVLLPNWSNSKNSQTVILFLFLKCTFDRPQSHIKKPLLHSIYDQRFPIRLNTKKITNIEKHLIQLVKTHLMLDTPRHTSKSPPSTHAHVNRFL